jgi:hypothetical protein
VLGLLRVAAAARGGAVPDPGGAERGRGAAEGARRQAVVQVGVGLVRVRARVEGGRAGVHRQGLRVRRAGGL